MTSPVPPLRRIPPNASIEELRQAVADLQEALAAREPREAGATINKFVTWESAVSAGIAQFSAGSSAARPILGPVPSGTPIPWVDDLTPAEPLSGLVVTSIPTGFFVTFDAPTYSQGGGNAYSIIYRAPYSGSGALPTFGDAEEVGRTTERSPVFILAAEPGTISHFWARPVTRAEDFAGIAPQTSPTGGTNGVSETAGQLSNTHIASLAVGKLLAGSLAVGEYLQSTGFVSGSYGFRLSGNGDAELSNATVRGTIYASAGQIGGINIYTNTIDSQGYNGTSSGFRLDGALGRIFAFDLRASGGTIGGAVIGSTSVQSSNFDASNGWKLDNASGTVTARAGEIGGFTIAAKSMRMGATGFQSGVGKWEGDVSGTFKFYMGDYSGGKYLSWDGTDLVLSGYNLGPFSATIPAGDVALNSVSSSTASRSVSVTGGTSPFDYVWSASPVNSYGSVVSLSNPGGTTTSLSVRPGAVGAGDGYTAQEYIVCLVRDANGRVAMASISLTCVFPE